MVFDKHSLIWLTLALNLVTLACHASSGPLRVRNIFPVAQLYGLPRALGAEMFDEGTEITFNIEHSNNFSSEASGNTFAFFDGETSVLSYSLRHGLGDGLEWGIEVPFVVHAGGDLDAFIDEFHEVFGFKDGGRSLAPRGRLDYLVRHDGFVYADFQDSKKHFGDVRTWIGYRVFESQQRSLGLRAMVKLATGNVDSLSGSEGTDIAFWVEYVDREIFGASGVTVSVMAGVVALGEGELAPSAQKDFAGIGHLGLQYELKPWLELHAQLDTHSELLDTGVVQVAQAGVQGSLGARFRVTPNFWVDVGVMEDLRSQSSPDIVFQLALGARL